jgi:hypothetical protein
MNRNTGWRGLVGCVGKVNPSGAVIWIVPSVIGRALLVTSNVMFTPLNVRVAALSPEPMTSVSVFSPLHTTVERQLNNALVEMVVRLMTIVSARASAVNAARERMRVPNVIARGMW